MTNKLFSSVNSFFSTMTNNISEGIAYSSTSNIGKNALETTKHLENTINHKDICVDLKATLHECMSTENNCSELFDTINRLNC